MKIVPRGEFATWRSRDDILVHAYAQCRSNKGAPGLDGRDFADIEAYVQYRRFGILRPSPSLFSTSSSSKMTSPIGMPSRGSSPCSTRMLAM
jgi:hypothetical protein